MTSVSWRRPHHKVISSNTILLCLQILLFDMFVNETEKESDGGRERQWKEVREGREGGSFRRRKGEIWNYKEKIVVTF